MVSWYTQSGAALFVRLPADGLHPGDRSRDRTATPGGASSRRRPGAALSRTVAGTVLISVGSNVSRGMVRLARGVIPGG